MLTKGEIVFVTCCIILPAIVIAAGAAASAHYDHNKDLGLAVKNFKAVVWRAIEPAMEKVSVVIWYLFDSMGLLQELEVLRKSLNRRAKVEQEMWEIVKGKKPLPDAEQIRKWAIDLGIPDEHRQVKPLK